MRDSSSEESAVRQEILTTMVKMGQTRLGQLMDCMCFKPFEVFVYFLLFFVNGHKHSLFEQPPQIGVTCKSWSELSQDQNGLLK